MFCCQLDHVFRWVGVIKTSLFRIAVLDRILGISIQMGEESLFLISVGYWCNIWLMISVMSKNKKMIGTPYMFITIIICINHVHYDRVLQNEWIINKCKHGWFILKNYICKSRKVIITDPELLIKFRIHKTHCIHTYITLHK